MEQDKAVFSWDHHAHEIFILLFTYGRRHVALRNVVLLGWDILISRRNGINVKYLKFHTYGTVALSLPFSLCCYRFNRAVSKLRFCLLTSGSMVPVLRNTQILWYPTSSWIVLCVVAVERDHCVAQISNCDSHFSVNKGIYVSDRHPHSCG